MIDRRVSEYFGDSTQLLYLRARQYAPNIGRFLTRDAWTGLPTTPISYNKWLYANSNPLYYTDSSGNFPIPLVLLLLGLGIITFGTSSCNVGPEPDVCPPLPTNLQPDKLSSVPREQALDNIRIGFSIQLPPSVTYIDVFGNSHSTSHHFVYSSSDILDHMGYTPWFSGNNVYLEAEWGDIVIYELAIKGFGFNAYDIASTMVHEAMHAWEQYSLAQLSQDKRSSFTQIYENTLYYTKEWEDRYTAVLEYEASSYVLQHTPTPLCTRKTATDNQTRYREKFEEDAKNAPIPGIGQYWPMAGYPLP